MRFVLLLILSLPAYTFAAVWHFVGVPITGFTFSDSVRPVSGDVNGVFTYDGVRITDWNLTARITKAGFPNSDSFTFFNEGPYEPLHPDWIRHSAQVLSPTRIQFFYEPSPASAHYLDFVLNNGSLQTSAADVQGTYSFDYARTNLNVAGHVFEAPEPQAFVILLVGMTLALKLRETRARHRQHLRRIA